MSRITGREVANLMEAYTAVYSQDLREELIFEEFLTEEFIPHFIRGYFDGDGSIGKYNERIKFSLLGTNDLLIWILNFFKNKGMKTTPKISKKKNIYTFQVNSKSDIELIENILYTSSNDYYLKRKKEKFK